MNRTSYGSVGLEMACLFLAWGATTTWLLVSGRYMLFLRPGFWSLLILSLCVLSGFVTAVLFRARPFRFGDSYAAVWIRVGVLVLPLFYLLVALEEPLGSHAFKNRSIPPTLAKAITPDRVRARDSKDGKVTLLELLQNFDEYRGKRVVTEGMVYRDEVVPPNHFLVFRFLIVCCAADALPAGALVEYDRAGDLEVDSWVRVEGVLDLKDVDGLVIPSIKADSVASIPALKLPYLYPGVF
jgi:putative membrane protein